MNKALLKLTINTANSCFQQGKLVKAIELAESALQMAKKFDLGSYLMCLEFTGALYLEADQDEKAEKNFRMLIRAVSDVLEEAPGDLTAEMLLSTGYAGLGRIYFKSLNYVEAIRFFSLRYDLTFRWLTGQTGENRPLEMREHFHALSCEQLCQLYLQKKSNAEALKYSSEFNLIMKELHMKDPENVTHAFTLATSYLFHGRALLLNEKEEQGAKSLKEGLILSEELGDRYPGSYEFLSGNLVLLESLGEFYTIDKNYIEALPYFLRQYAVAKRLSQLNKDTTSTEFNIGSAACKLADAYVNLKMLDEAWPYLLQMEQIFTELTGGSAAHLSHYHNLYFTYATFIDYHKARGNLKAAIISGQHTVATLSKMYDMTSKAVTYRNLLGKHYRIISKLYQDDQNDDQAREYKAKADRLIRP